MDYIGSKIKLNNWIFEIINKSTHCIKNVVFLDACSGSGAVSKFAAKLGYQVLSNDIMKFPSTIINGSIGVSKNQQNLALTEIDRLNQTCGINGYFYNNFCDESSPKRFYFTASNARIIDGIRREIDTIDDPKIKDYLLYCGIEAISRVSNTTGVQAAFLKRYKDRAKETFQLQHEDFIKGIAKTFNRDILSLLTDNEFRNKYKEDVLYIDPPYNHRQYGSNYHLYETFVKNDRPPPVGKTGLRNWKIESSSQFCNKRNCLQHLQSIVSLSTAKSIFVSYSSDGLLSSNEIETAFPGVIIHKRDHRRYKADTSEDRLYNENKLFEFLFEIKK